MIHTRYDTSNSWIILNDHKWNEKKNKISLETRQKRAEYKTDLQTLHPSVKLFT